MFTLFSCIIFPACAKAGSVENDRMDKSEIKEWDIASSGAYSSPVNLGIPFRYEFENATIETSHLNVDAAIIIAHKSDIISDWDNLSNHKWYDSCKIASLSDCPLISLDAVRFELTSLDCWGYWDNRENINLTDYVTLIARKENNIVGYAVMYIYSVNGIGGGEVLVDKEFPKVNGKYQEISEETVREKIQTVIDGHKNSLAK